MKEAGQAPEFQIDESGTIRYKKHWCVPNDEDLIEKLLKKAHNSNYSIYPGGDKLYKDLKEYFWWPRMKQNVVNFVAKYLTCQKVKIQHMKLGGKLQTISVPGGKLQTISVPGWKWESISIDFIMALPKTKTENNAIWVIVDRLTKIVRFVAMKDTWSMQQLTNAYLNEVIRLHGVPKV